MSATIFPTKHSKTVEVVPDNPRLAVAASDKLPGVIFSKAQKVNQRTLERALAAASMWGLRLDTTRIARW